MTEETISPKQLRKLVERILDLKARQDMVDTAIRKAYADVKAAGLDKPAIGQLVTFLRKKVRDPEKFEADSAVFELYRKTYESPSHAHAREEDISKVADESAETSGSKVVEAGDEPAPVIIAETVAESTRNLQHPSQSDPYTLPQQYQTAPISPQHFELRPLCRNPNHCAGYGRTVCKSCLGATTELLEPDTVP